jgi:hypothetical protein
MATRAWIAEGGRRLRSVREYSIAIEEASVMRRVSWSNDCVEMFETEKVVTPDATVGVGEGNMPGRACVVRPE